MHIHDCADAGFFPDLFDRVRDSRFGGEPRGRYRQAVRWRDGKRLRAVRAVRCRATG
jgi:hypothetical protein